MYWTIKQSTLLKQHENFKIEFEILEAVYIKLCVVLQVKVQGQYEEMLLAACEQFLGKSEAEVQQVALETLEGHQRAIMGSMSVEV